VAKAQAKPTEHETSELRQSHLAVRRQLRKKKKTKAAREYGAPISDLEHMRGRGGTDMTTGIKGSGLGDLKVFAQRWLDSKKRAQPPPDPWLPDV
jgi:hypothetical protein